MTAEAFASFLALPDQDRRDVFTAASRRLVTAPTYVEKDFWVCLVLDLLFNTLSAGHPKLLFKGGTSVSNACGLIRRLSALALPPQAVEVAMEYGTVIRRNDTDFGRSPGDASIATYVAPM